MKQISIWIIITCWAITTHAQNTEESTASEEWTKEDSLPLSSFIGEDKPIQINPAARHELEQLFEQSMLPVQSDDSWKKFIKYTVPKVHIRPFKRMYLPAFSMSKTMLSGKELLKNESLREGRFHLQSRWNADPLKGTAQRTTHLDISLTRRLKFFVGGGYGVSQKHSPILPTFVSPYQLDAGFSYHINKSLQLKSGCTYQYNVIQKRWEWCFTMGLSAFF